MKRNLAVLAASFIACCASSNSFAQTAPNAGVLLHEYEKSVPMPPAPASPALPPAVEAPDETSGKRILVKGFTIDAHQFPEAELQSEIAEFLGQELSLADLQRAARKISSYYLAKGFVARAYLPPQTIKDGIVKIVVQEGKLGQIRIDPSSHSRFSTDAAKAFVEDRAEQSDILRTGDLYEGLAVLNEEPGIEAASTLQAGANPGETDAVVKLNDTALLNGSLQVDSEGIRSVGSTRGIASGFVNDALGIGDQVAATFLKTSGSDYSRLALTLPAGSSGLRYGLDASMMHYQVDPDFSSADQTGYAYTFGGTLSYPVFRRPTYSLTTDITYDHKRLSNAVEDLNTSDKEIDVGSLLANGVSADGFLAGGVNTISASMTFGSIDLEGDQGNYLQDQSSARVDGFYAHFNATATRLQSFDDVNQLFLSVSAQYAPQNLDSSEQISLGGPDGVRAYPTDEALGDMGMLDRVELRHNIYGGVQLIDFYDAGWIQQHEHTWAGWSSGQANAYWLQDVGVGVNWKPVDRAALSATLAHTLGSNLGQINGYNSDGYDSHLRLLLQASYSF